MEKLTEIGRVIKNKRLSLNLRMEDVARECQITRATLSSIENGTGNPSIVVVLKLFDVLGLFFDIEDESLSGRNRATRINLANDKKINRFVIMCIEQYAYSRNLSSQEAYEKMSRSGVIDDLTNDYEDLHGFSFEYLNDYIGAIVEGEKRTC